MEKNFCDVEIRCLGSKRVKLVFSDRMGDQSKIIMTNEQFEALTYFLSKDHAIRNGSIRSRKIRFDDNYTYKSG